MNVLFGGASCLMFDHILTKILTLLHSHKVVIQVVIRPMPVWLPSVLKSAYHSSLFWPRFLKIPTPTSLRLTPSYTPSLRCVPFEGVRLLNLPINARLSVLAPSYSQVLLHSATPPFHACAVSHNIRLRRIGSPPCWSARRTPEFLPPRECSMIALYRPIIQQLLKSLQE